MIPGVVTTIPNYMILKELGWLNTFYALIVQQQVPLMVPSYFANIC